MTTMALSSSNREPELGNLTDILSQKDVRENFQEIFKKGLSLDYSEPTQIVKQQDLALFLYKEPKVDILFDSKKIPPADAIQDVKTLKKHLLKLYGGVIFAHAIVFLFFVGALDIQPFLLKNAEKAVPVEVVFGVTSDLSTSAPAMDSKQNSELNKPREALKTELQLPQLPKVVAVKEAVADEEDIEEEKETPKEALEKKAIKTSTPPVQGAKILSVQELLKLAEKESRRIGKREQEGVKTPSGNDVAAMHSNRSNSPASAQALNQSALPLGTLDGNKFGDLKDAYSANVGNHIKRIWKIPETAKFNPDIDVIVKFEVNTFGHILGDVIIDTSSGNREFDKLALDVVKEGEPYPELPQELRPKMTLRVKLKPKDVKER